MADNNMIPIMNARADAVAFISTGRKTSGKVRLKLKLKGHSEEVIAEVIRQLTEEMRIDDLAYARDLIRSRKGKRSLSINALRIRLSDAGLSRDSVSSALNEIHDIRQFEINNAGDLLNLKFGEKADRMLPNDTGEYKRLVSSMYRFLFSKGFGEEIAGETVRRFMDDKRYDE